MPDYTRSISDRSALAEDWGGARPALAGPGIQLELALTPIDQGVSDGGRGNEDWGYHSRRRSQDADPILAENTM